jgi:hypothetical protein
MKEEVRSEKGEGMKEMKKYRFTLDFESAIEREQSNLPTFQPFNLLTFYSLPYISEIGRGRARIHAEKPIKNPRFQRSSASQNGFVR